MASLTEITGVESNVLEEKFDLEPRHRYDREEEDNLVFFSPTVLLRDTELGFGGIGERGAKEFLSQITKEIIQNENRALFQVPEITYLHMGYGKNSENKEGKMALTKKEADFWMKYLKLSRFSNADTNCSVENEGTPPYVAHKRSRSPDTLPKESLPMEESSTGDEELEEMEVDFPLPTPEDTQAFETNDEEYVISPTNSGLKIALKGNYILFFSILLIFFLKRKKSASTDDKNIGANKISDFLVFWCLPYLLNFSQRKVREIQKHHEMKEGDQSKFTVPTVDKSVLDVIEEATACGNIPPEVKKHLVQTYQKYLGTDQLSAKYTLLKAMDGSPVILVPMRYQEKKMSTRIDDIGNMWREMGNSNLVEKFVGTFVKSKEIQKDYFKCMKDLELRQGVDYGIILPDLDTYNEFLKTLNDDHPDILSSLRHVEQQGRDLITPRHGVLEYKDKKLIVAFSYLQGVDSSRVSALFRAIGAHYLNHFTLVVLPGYASNPEDPDCRGGDLHPVRRVVKLCSTAGKFRQDAKQDLCIGRFTKIDFPETWKSWKQAVCNDDVVKELVSTQKNVNPEFKHNKPLVVGYSRAYNKHRLKRAVLKVTADQERFSIYKIGALNLDGCLLSKITRSGRNNNVAVVLATCMLERPVNSDNEHGRLLKKAIRNVVNHFVRAVVAADLSLVYPAEPDKQNREDCDLSCNSSDEEDSSDEEQKSAAGPSKAAGSTNNMHSETGIKFKEGKPDDGELEELADEIPKVWEKLGRRLGIPEPRLEAFKQENDKVHERAYEMLKHWKQKNDKDATYKALYHALCHKLVERTDLANKYCCQC